MVLRNMLTHPGKGAEQIVLLPPHWTPKQCLPVTFVQAFELPFQPVDVALHSWVNCSAEPPNTVFIRDQPGHQLVSWRCQLVEIPGIRIPQSWTDRLELSLKSQLWSAPSCETPEFASSMSQ